MYSEKNIVVDQDWSIVCEKLETIVAFSVSKIEALFQDEFRCLEDSQGREH